MTEEKKDVDKNEEAKQAQERMTNCAKEVLAVLHKYDCILTVQTQIDCNGNTNSGIGIVPINRQVTQPVDLEEDVKEE